MTLNGPYFKALLAVFSAFERCLLLFGNALAKGRNLLQSNRNGPPDPRRPGLRDRGGAARDQPAVGRLLHGPQAARAERRRAPRLDRSSGSAASPHRARPPAGRVLGRDGG